MSMHVSNKQSTCGNMPSRGEEIDTTRWRVTPISVEDQRWGTFVESRSEASVFQYPAWTRALMDEYGCESSSLACEDELGNIQGILPLMRTRGIPVKIGPHVLDRRIASLPRTPFAGPIGASVEATKRLLAAVVADAEQSKSTAQIKTYSNECDCMVEGLVGVPWKATYVLRLHGDGNGVLLGRGKNRKKILWSVERAAKLGVKVRWSDSEMDLQSWFELYAETMRWHGTLPRNYRFFSSLWRYMHKEGRIRLLLAEKEVRGRPRLLSGYLYLVYGKTFHCWLNGRRRDSLKFSPNYALHWHAMNDAYRDGYQVYDFGEVDDDDPGLIAFKAKWGAEPMCTYRYYFPMQTARVAKVRPAGKILEQVGKRLWRKVPISLVLRLADLVYSFL